MSDNELVIDDADEPNRSEFTAALARFVEEYHRELVRRLSRRLPPEEAKDVVQTAYLSLLAKPPQLARIRNFRNYFYGVLHNRVCDWIDQQQRRRLLKSKLMRVALEGVPMQVPSAEAYVALAQDIEAQLGILKEKAPRALEAFEYVRVQGLTVERAAQLMGLSRDQASRMVGRVLLRLQALDKPGEPR